MTRTDTTRSRTWGHALTGVLLGLASLIFVQVAQAQEAEVPAEDRAALSILFTQMESRNMDAAGKRGFGYSDPAADPFGHFSSDIQPWIQMGAGRGDSPNPKNRIKAYVADLEAALPAARAAWANRSANAAPQDQAAQLPTVWIVILQDEAADDLLELIRAESAPDRKTVKRTFKAVRKRMQAVY